MMRLKSYIPLLAVSVFAASLSGGQPQKKTVGLNAPDLYPGGFPAEQLASQVPVTEASGGVDGITPIMQPDADYRDRTTLFPDPGPDFTIVTTQTDPASGCMVTYSTPLQARTVPGSWATWGSPPDTETSTPRILWTQGATSVTLTFAPDCGVLTTIGLEAEPNPFAVFPFTATFSLGGVTQGTVMRSIDGSFGGRLLAADGSFDRVVVSCAGCDFAIARVRFAQGVQAILQGQVTDAKTGAGIRGAQLEAVGDITRGTLTDAMGNYRMRLPNGTYDVTTGAFRYGCQTTSVTVSDTAPTTQNFALTRGCAAPP